MATCSSLLRRIFISGMLLFFTSLSAAVRPAVIVKDAPPLRSSSSLTIDGWFFLKTEQLLPSSRLVSKYGHIAPEQRGWELHLSDDKLVFRVNCLLPSGERQDFELESTDPVPRERWVHLAATFADEGNGLKRLYVFVDGRESGRFQLPPNSVLNPNADINVFPGVYSGTFGSETVMLLDDFRLSSRIIHFNGTPTRPASPNEPGTLALFSFDDEPFTAPGITAGIIGEAKLTPGRFGQAIDLTGEIDPELFRRAAALGRRPLLDEHLDGEFRLMVHTDQPEAKLLLIPDFDRPIRLKGELRAESDNRVISTFTRELSGKAEWAIPISRLGDGNYLLTLSAADPKEEFDGSFVRRLRIQRPRPTPPPPEPITLSGEVVFPIDEYHFARREGVTNRIVPPRMVTTTRPLGKQFAWQRSFGPNWFGVDSAGNFVQRFTAGADWSGGGASVFYAFSRDGADWQLSSTPPGGRDNPPIPDLFPPTAAAAVRWHNRTPFNQSEVRLYSAADGVPPLNEVRMQCLAPHISDPARYGFIPWGTYPVWEKRPGLWLILTREPSCVCKFGYAERELEQTIDANDNFGGQYLSDDGKTACYAQAAKLHVHAPLAVEYDNIPDSFRLMRVYSSRDGFNWEGRYVIIPDELDHPTLQHYGFTSLRAGKELRIGLLHAYQVEKQQIYSELVFSRDGMEWTRLDDRTPFFGNDVQPGEPFFGMIFTDFENTPVFAHGDEYFIALGSQWHQRPHFYFTYGTPEQPESYTPEALRRTYGRRQLAERWPFFTAVGGWEGLSRDFSRFPEGASTVGFARLRRDGWIAVTSSDRGVLTSRLWSAPGNRMALNGRGEFSVELLDADGKPLPGYSGDAAARFSGDSVEAVLNWNGREKLPEIPFRAVISMDNAEIYTIKLLD